jgi:hypothetical protein
MTVRSKTWMVVWRARRVTGASTPLRADLERMVLQMAHDEWKSTTRAIFSLDGGRDST